MRVSHAQVLHSAPARLAQSLLCKEICFVLHNIHHTMSLAATEGKGGEPNEKEQNPCTQGSPGEAKGQFWQGLGFPLRSFDAGLDGFGDLYLILRISLETRLFFQPSSRGYKGSRLEMARLELPPARHKCTTPRPQRIMRASCQLPPGKRPRRDMHLEPCYPLQPGKGAHF